MLDKYGRKILPKKPGYIKLGVPGKYYEMVVEHEKFTRAKRDPRSGRMMGRYAGVKSYMADSKKYLMMKEDVDLYGDKRPDLYKGQIIGRVKKEIQVKPRHVTIYVKKKAPYPTGKAKLKKRFKK